jgi:hypothetical protein
VRLEQEEADLINKRAHGPGCSSLGQIAEHFQLSRNVLQVALNMHTNSVIEALAAVFIPSTLTANMPALPDGQAPGQLGVVEGGAEEFEVAQRWRCTGHGYAVTRVMWK